MEDKKLFSTTEYAHEKLDVKNTAQVSSSPEKDLPMSENDNTAGAGQETPRTMSIAPSDPFDTPRESTRASTPADGHNEDLPTQPMTPKAGRQVAATDDVPMMDISPIK